jgi:hypothetical protein
MYPDFIPQNKPKSYIPRIYGFKLFGKKGSKFEGVPLPENKEEKENTSTNANK